MQRFVMLLTATALLGTTVAIAQQRMAPQQPRPAQARQAEPGLSGIEELKYIVAMIDLDAEQRQQAEGLLDEYEFQASQEPDRSRMVDILQQFGQAQQAGDQEEVQRLREELRNLQPEPRARREFMSSFKAMLTTEQLEELERVTTLLDKNPSGKLRPYDVVRIVTREIDLDADQRTEFLAVHKQFRDQVAGERNQGTIPDSDIPKRFALAVRAILTPDQAKIYDRQVGMITLEVPEASGEAEKADAEEPADEAPSEE